MNNENPHIEEAKETCPYWYDGDEYIQVANSIAWIRCAVHSGFGVVLKITLGVYYPT